MTDNKDLYIKFLRLQGLPENGKDYNKYYVIELIRRGKDNPSLPVANVHFKNYYIDSIEHFIKCYDEIKTLCNVLNMRAYFSVNYKCCDQILLDTIAESARRAAIHDYKKPWAIYESCSDKFSVRKDRKWIIDIDNCDIKDDRINQYISIIHECSSYPSIIYRIPTKSGVHLIVKPFNKVEFFNQCIAIGLPIPDIKNNHLTLLYENIK